MTAKDHTGPLLRIALESFLIAGRKRSGNDVIDDSCTFLR
jgi:hypothetical protein